MELFQKRIVITRPRAQAEDFASALLDEGATPIFLPTIEIIPLADFTILDAALRNLDRYDWLILTSIHAVDAFFSRLSALGIKQVPSQMRIAAVGPKTVLALSEYEMSPDFVPTEYTAQAILPGLGEAISRLHFLFPQSNLAGNTLAKEIRRLGGVVDEIVAYHNVKVKLDSSGMNALCLGTDVITFASPSSVHGFVDVIQEHGFNIHNLPGNPIFACIGPSTSYAAREASVTVRVEAREYTIAGLVSALKKTQEFA